MIPTKRLVVLSLGALAGALLSGCGADGVDGAVATGSEAEWLDEYGVEGPFDTGPKLGKSDGVGRAGPYVSWNGGASQVWAVEHEWADVTAEAGVAWEANSGLDWNAKYSAWVAGLEPIDVEQETSWGTNTRHTFQITTPWGKTLPAPVLECAEVAIFMRATFSSWYHLPFYMEAADGGKPLYLGHFGFLRHDGTSFGNAPSFKRRYTDHTGSWEEGQAWPSDSKLRARGLYGGGDEIWFLDDIDGEPARAGAYFDEIYLNKRVGHFMLLVLSWFGSIHLADERNMFHATPDSIRPGDVLLERWQRQGIGHTIPVMRVKHLEGGRIEVAVATGSMPRRVPKWEEGAAASHYFTMEETGGEGDASDGTPFAALGGGLRRWRVAVRSGDRYRNTFFPGDDDAWINSTDIAAVAARPGRFGELMRELSPEEKRDVALGQIEAARQHLSEYPASCSARTRREEGFAELYDVGQEHLDMDRAAVDAEYRILDDYVFAELAYESSRTCCWNSSTTAMYLLVMAYNEQHLEDAAEGTCNEPIAFMARDIGPDSDGYDLWREFAVAQGKGDDWVAWSEDEPCPWAAQSTDDVEAEHAWTPWCTLQAAEPTGSGG